jgi:hypothetical protein
VLCVYLPLIVSNCTGKHLVSKLKCIKNDMRNRMGQERHNTLLLMSIENEVLHGANAAAALINKFVTVKPLKLPLGEVKTSFLLCFV